VTADIIVMEEADFIKPELFFTVVVPLLGVEGTAVLAISTPGKNYYSALMDLKDPDDETKPFFKTIRIGLACDACLSSGKAEECTHMSHLLPHWKSAERQRKMAKIMNDGQLFMQENMGLIASGFDFVFKATLVDSMLTTTHTWQTPPGVVYCAIDPSGGGAQSDYSMVTVATQMGHYAIIAMDSTPSAQIDDVNSMIYSHIKAIRQHSMYSNSVIVVFIEANMSWLETDRVALICQRPELQPVYIEQTETARGISKPGVITTEATKVGYVYNTRQLLQGSHLTFATAYIINEDQDACTKEALLTQLRAFRKCTKGPRDIDFGRSKVSYSGKAYNKKDDLAMCLMMAIYFSFATRRSHTFNAIAERNGWVTE
jgi:hypothetical protein